MSSLLLIFVCGGVAIFVGFESGQNQSVNLLQKMVYNTTQNPPTPREKPNHTIARKSGPLEIIQYSQFRALQVV